MDTYTQLGLDIIHYGENKFNKNMTKKFKKTPFSINNLAQAISVDSSDVYKYLKNNADGYPVKPMNLFTLIKIIIAVKAEPSVAYRWIDMAGFSINSDNLIDNKKYREIVGKAAAANWEEMDNILSSVQRPKRSSKEVMFLEDI